MSSSSEYISIGKIAGTHGLKGDLVLKHALGKKTALKNLNAIFIKDRAGNHIPWFLETGKIKTATETFLKLEGINTVEDARLLVQKEVWLAIADFDMQAARNSVISYVGYKINEHGNILGTICEIIEQPHQILCKLLIKEKEVLIPLHEETLLKVDAKDKIIYVELPEGLLDIYLT